MKTACLLITYQHARWIGEALDSVLGQTLPFGHVVVVDDGSNDGTREAIGDAVRGLSGATEITVLDSPRGGPQRALNLGLEAIRLLGVETVSLMSGDDIAHQERLERQLFVLEETGADGVFSRPQLIDAAGRLLRDEVAPEFFRPITDESLYAQLLAGNFLCAPSATIRIAALPSAPEFNSELLHLQDYELWLRMLRGGRRFVVDEIRSVSYRVHEAQLSAEGGAARQSARRREFVSVYEAERNALLEADLGDEDYRIAAERIEQALDRVCVGWQSLLAGAFGARANELATTLSSHR